MIELTDTDLLLRLAKTEDNFVERKTENDLKDCLKTAVAFANTTPIGYPAILFVGVRDNGQVEGVTNPDNIQKSLSDKIAQAYPPIYMLTRVLKTKDGKQVLAVIIPGSENRPHFAGKAYIRDGSKSVPSSESQFRVLIAQRNDKARMILESKGKVVTVEIQQTEYEIAPYSGHPIPRTKRTKFEQVVIDCNQFYVSLQSHGLRPEAPKAYPLSAIEVNFDHKRDRLMVLIKER